MESWHTQRRGLVRVDFDTQQRTRSVRLLGAAAAFAASAVALGVTGDRLWGG